MQSRNGVLLFVACETEKLEPKAEKAEVATAEVAGEAEIRASLKAYRDALAEADVEQVAATYAANGVVMEPGAPTAAGEALGATYSAIFSSVGLDLDFTLANVIIGKRYAFVQSTSDGTALIKATGEKVPEQNRELFVFENEAGTWKLARYMYNKMDKLVPATNVSVVKNEAEGSSPEDEKEACELIANIYRDALAASDAGAVLSAFSSDAVVMLPGGATYRGAEAVKENYEGIFEAVLLDLQFAIDEVVLDGDFGFARSTSNGTLKSLEGGTEAPEVNRELWILRRENGARKIAFYMHNKMS